MRAVKGIKVGDEITVDYGFMFGREGSLFCKEPGCNKNVRENPIRASELRTVIENYKIALVTVRQYAADAEKSVGFDTAAFEEKVQELQSRMRLLELLEGDRIIPDHNLPIVDLSGYAEYAEVGNLQQKYVKIGATYF